MIQILALLMLVLPLHAAELVVPVPLEVKSVITTSVSVTQTAVQILGDNPNRLGFAFYNNGANSSYVKFGPPAGLTSSTPSMIIATFASFFWPLPLTYTGPISAIRNAGGGTFTFTEFEKK